MATPIEKFGLTVEMLHNNKINKSNAFDLRPLDYIDEVFQSFSVSSSGELVWQKYSTGIDSCSKIYGYCVDSLHAETYKLLSGMARSENKPEQVAEEGSLPKKKTVGVGTLETDLSAITSKKLEKSTEFDPYFKLLSGKFDASNAGGLLLNAVELNGRLDVILGDDDTSSGLLVENTGNEVDIEQLRDKDYESLLSTELCGALRRFEQSSVTVENVIDYMNIEYEVLEDSQSEREEEQGPKVWNITHKIEDQISSLLNSNEFQYFNPKLGAWAGIEFWKKLSTKSTKKPNRKVNRITEDKVFLTSDPVNKKKILEKPEGRSTNYTNREAEDCYIPRDLEFSLERLSRMLSRPQTLINHNNNEVEVPEFNYFEEILEAEPVVHEEIEPTLLSKNVDIKALKNKMWGQLSCGNKENAEQLTFKRLLNSLPADLHQAELANLSVHSCFITVLHLANDHSLNLESMGDCDFQIDLSLSK